MKVIGKVSDSGTGATVYYSYSFRRFSFCRYKANKTRRKDKEEKTGMGKCRHVWRHVSVCLLELGGNITAFISSGNFLVSFLFSNHSNCIKKMRLD